LQPNHEDSLLVEDNVKEGRLIYQQPSVKTERLK
jgi:hypothetical protein